MVFIVRERSSHLKRIAALILVCVLTLKHSSNHVLHVRVQNAIQLGLHPE